MAAICDELVFKTHVFLVKSMEKELVPDKIPIIFGNWVWAVCFHGTGILFLLLFKSDVFGF